MITGIVASSMPYPAGGGEPVPAPSDFSVAGAWTWFNDPRAIAVDNGIVVGAITGDGDLMAYEMGDGTGVDLRGSLFEVDDHDNPALLRRSSDGRLLAFASAHNGAGYYTYLSTNPDDASSWGSETNIDSQLGRSDYTYANPVQLTGETDDPIYNFFRASDGTNLQWYYTKSTDQGTTWSSATHLIQRESGIWPGYMRCVQNGDSRIDFFCNDGHPVAISDNSLYHFYYEGGSFRDTAGNALTLPIDPRTDLTPLYDGTTDHSWIHHCAVDGSGNPVCVFAIFPTDDDHRYRYAIWNGASWTVSEICAAGRGLLPADGFGTQYYSGGVVIDPDNVNRVFASRETNGLWEIYRFTTADGGATWDAGERVTYPGRNFRPYVVKGASEPRLLYVKGRYNTTFDDFDTTIELIDSTTTAAEVVGAGSDPDRASVVLHVRPWNTADVSPSERVLTWGRRILIDGEEVVMPGISGTTGSGVITAPDSADFTFAGDFTIDIFGAKFATVTVLQVLVSHWRGTPGNRSWQSVFRGDTATDTLGIFLSSDGTGNNYRDAAWLPVVDQAYDLRIERASGTVRLFVDGVMIGKEADSTVLKDSPSRLVIGSIEDASGIVTTAGLWNGRFKELRITAAARHGSDASYTVESLPLPTS